MIAHLLEVRAEVGSLTTTVVPVPAAPIGSPACRRVARARSRNARSPKPWRLALGRQSDPSVLDRDKATMAPSLREPHARLLDTRVLCDVEEQLADHAEEGDTHVLVERQLILLDDTHGQAVGAPQVLGEPLDRRDQADVVKQRRTQLKAQRGDRGGGHPREKPLRLGHPGAARLVIARRAASATRAIAAGRRRREGLTPACAAPSPRPGLPPRRRLAMTVLYCAASSRRSTPAESRSARGSVRLSTYRRSASRSHCHLPRETSARSRPSLSAFEHRGVAVPAVLTMRRHEGRELPSDEVRRGPSAGC